MTSYRLAVDIGGTFTDSVLAQTNGRIVASAKTLTSHANPALAALEGARRAAKAAGVALTQVSGFVHGTTLATNALIEKRGSRVATISTEGFRDILDIAYERRYAQYDINLQKPDYLVPRTRALTVPERIAADGSVLIPLDRSALPGLLAALDATGAQAVAICLINAYANNAHEVQLRDYLACHRPDLVVTLSSEVSPEAREFDRMCTAVANAYVQPMMSRYLAAFSEQFVAAGVTCPILMMTAGGGMTTLETAARFPIRLVESGPAGGAILAAQIARGAGLDRVVSFDMGGTTAKLCLIDDARPQTARAFEIARAARFVKGSGLPVRIPVIEMIEIGAGGGSIAAMDRLGRLTVGPHSAGSEPGPVAFGRGGTQPTVTDADVTLGYIQPDHFAEGQFTLDPAAAQGSFVPLAKALGGAAQDAADGVSRVVDEAMASAGRMHAVESGKDLAARTMVAFGGNGPLHATRVARSAGVTRILIPPNPSVGSAVGFLFAPVSFEMVRSRYTVLDAPDLAAINALLAEMEDEARAVVALGAAGTVPQIRRTAFMRYHGQGHEIDVALPSEPLRQADLPALQDAFEARYRTQFSRPVPGMQIEVLNWAVSVATPDAAPALVPETPPARPAPAAQSVSIMCDVTTTPVCAALHHRAALAPGDTIRGPALICEPQTTTLISADFDAQVDGHRNLILIQRALPSPPGTGTGTVIGPASDCDTPISKGTL